MKNTIICLECGARTFRKANDNLCGECVNAAKRQDAWDALDKLENFMQSRVDDAHAKQRGLALCRDLEKALEKL